MVHYNVYRRRFPNRRARKAAGRARAITVYNRGRVANPGRLMRSLLNKSYTFKVRCPVPPGNINVLNALYGTVVQPFSGTGVPTLLNGQYGAGAPGTEASFAMWFSLQDIPGYSAYTQLFDQYKITNVKVILTMQGETGDGVYSTTTQASQQSDKLLWYTIDQDDAAAVSRVAMQEYQTATMHPFNPFGDTKPVIVSFKPHIAVAAYNGSFGGYLNRNPEWLDTSYPNVQHYGFKVCFSSPLAAAEASVRWGVYATYSLSFKNVK